MSDLPTFELFLEQFKLENTGLNLTDEEMKNEVAKSRKIFA